MTDQKLYGSFVAQKISKIRFVQEQFNVSNSFIAGSWCSQTNSIDLWRLTKDEYSEDDDETEYIPISVAKISVNGDVTGLEFLNYDNVAVSTTCDESPVLIVNINRNILQDNLVTTQTFTDIHKFKAAPAACTALSVFEGDIASVGEDGTLNILSSDGRIVKQFMNVDSCSMTSVAFINHKEILTGNRIGTLNIFDAGNNNNKPTYSLSVSSEDDKRTNGITCIAYHPIQKHIVLCGSEEGSLTVWDLRNPMFPASYLSAHESPITDMAYHRTDPTKLYTASEAGELFQWSYKLNQISDRIDGQVKAPETDNINPWLCGERTKNKINWQPLIKGIRKSVNTFDCNGSKIICGCNNEAVYLIDNNI